MPEVWRPLAQRRWEALLGGLTTFAEAPQLLETFTGVDVGIETLRTHAEAAGTELEGEQRAAGAHVAATQEPPAYYDPVPTDQVLVVEADGVMARYRDRQLDGTLINGEWHEIKLGLAGAWHGDQLISPSYVAARETASTFAPRLGTEAARRGALDIVGWRGRGTDGGGEEAVLRRVVVVGDGAKWIWKHVATTFGSERVEILDWYHCCQHLGAVGAALHSAETPQAEAWVNHAKDVIKPALILPEVVDEKLAAGPRCLAPLTVRLSRFDGRGDQAARNSTGLSPHHC